MERFEYEFIEISKNEPSDPDPAYVEEMEKPRRGMLLAKKSHLRQASSMFLTSKRRKYPEAFKAFEKELGG